ncbi:MAG: BlaI/MecI/CopY family transcriptional regulator [Bacteroidaceae bacterium]|nr:BlaI/MecI/CopY family transcriptional regulator [Bacteroidaceae bacterium]
MKEKKFLTKAEHQVMLILWNLKEKGGFTNDILKGYEEPKPAYTTLATFLKILVNKGFVKSSKVGSMLYFTPKVSKMDYCKIVMEKACNDYFDGDIVKFFQFLAKNNELTAEQKEEVLSALK